jgi:large subunit ribosomal protein L25
METLSLAAKTRSVTGKRVKDLRVAGEVPAVLYGHGVEARSLTIPAGAFRKVHAKAGSSALVDVAIDGATPVKAIIHEVQPNPLTMEAIHVDFHQVRMDEKMTARIPLVFIGESEAVKALGGSLMKSADSVEVECLPGDLPHELAVDISVLKTFEDDILMSNLVLPKGVELVTEGHMTIASVTPPLTAEQLAKMEESQVGDIAAVKTESDEKTEAAAAAEAAGEKGDEKKAE